MIKSVSEINMDLFTRGTITTYGVKLEHFDKELYEKNKHMNNVTYDYFLTVHILKDGGVNIVTTNNIHLTNEQLNEIMRISKLVQEAT